MEVSLFDNEFFNHGIAIGFQLYKVDSLGQVGDINRDFVAVYMIIVSRSALEVEERQL